MQDSKIGWCHDTDNLWWGCQEVHKGCDNCYAKVMDNRWGGSHWGPHSSRRMIKSVWSDFARQQKLAESENTIRRVFVGSMMDIFEVPKPLVDSQGNPAIDASDGSPITTEYLRERYFHEVVPNTPNLLHLMLTKRPGNILKMIPEEWKTGPPKNVMYGTSVVDQPTADDMILKLLQVPGRHFLSMEPLVGPVELPRFIRLSRLVRGDFPIGHNTCAPAGIHKVFLNQHGARSVMAENGDMLGIKPDECEDLGLGVDWVIVGGESGNKARPMHPSWARSLAFQCKNENVPFFFKQWGDWKEGASSKTSMDKWAMVDKEGKIYQGTDMIPQGMNTVLMSKVGKHDSGRLLNNVEYSEFPEHEIFNNATDQKNMHLL